MLRPLKKNDALIVARLHKEALAGDFLPSLGQNFLAALYTGILEEPGVVGIGITKDSLVVGFIIGATNMPSFLRLALKKKFLELSYFSLMGFLRHPSLILKCIETFTYPSKEKGPPAELVVIAVTQAERGQGLGKKLVCELEKAFQKVGIKEYKVTVTSHKTARKFYERLNFAILSKFKLYNKLWYVYDKKI